MAETLAVTGNPLTPLHLPGYRPSVESGLQGKLADGAVNLESSHQPNHYLKYSMLGTTGGARGPVDGLYDPTEYERRTFLEPLPHWFD